MTYKIVSFYTPNYGEEALRLEASLAHFDLDSDVCTIDYPGEPLARYPALNYKPSFILQKIREHNCPIVWLDADSQVVSYPYLFELGRLDSYDIAYFLTTRSNGVKEPHTGTLFFNNTPISKQFLADWEIDCLDNYNTDDQIKFERLLLSYRALLNIYRLPQSYCKIFDHDREDCDQVDVIRQFQANRKHKFADPDYQAGRAYRK